MAAAANNARASKSGLQALHDRLLALAADADGDPADPMLADRLAEVDAALEIDAPAAGWSSADDSEFAALLARCLKLVADVAYAARSFDLARRRLEQAVAIGTVLAETNAATAHELCAARCSLARTLARQGMRREALEVAEVAMGWYRDQLAARPDDPVLLVGLADARHVAGHALGSDGRCAEAAVATGEAVALRERLLDARNAGQLVEAARSHGNLGNWYGDLGRFNDALRHTERALALLREFERLRPLAAQIELAREANNLGTRLSDLGRRGEALGAVRESLQRRRALAQRNPAAFAAELASTLHNLGAMLYELERFGEALVPTREAIALRRQLAADHPRPYRHLLMDSLINEGAMLEKLGLFAQSLAPTREAVELLRDGWRDNPALHGQSLGIACHTLAKALRASGDPASAAAASREAVLLFRHLAEQAPLAARLSLASGLVEWGGACRELQRYVDARAAAREAAGLLLEEVPDNPFLWGEIVEALAPQLVDDDAGLHRELLREIAERRELAHDAAQAALYSSLQASLSVLAWNVVARLYATGSKAEADAQAALIVGLLQGPDLQRWLAARGGSDAEQAMTEARRSVLVADQAYVELVERQRSGENVTAELADAARRSAERRQSYREARARLLASPLLRAAFEPAMPTELQATLKVLATRAAGQHIPPARTHTTALLCLLVLRDAAGNERAVGWLLGDKGTRGFAVEFPGLLALVRDFERPSVRGAASRSQRLRRPAAQRGAGGAAGNSATLQARYRPATDAAISGSGALQAALRQEFWQPLRQALMVLDSMANKASSFTIDLHICVHGRLQQLPLGWLDDEGDAALLTLRPMLWPGLPYLRAAVAQAQVPTDGPWQIAYDCAWNTEPLPMAAVEAGLLRQLLPPGAAQMLRSAEQLGRGAGALVVCGHGDDARHLNSALAIGGEVLTLQRVVDEQLAPPLAVLPLCHAGDTTEDFAGNAFGVAAGFLLGGARLVVASSRAVDDQLIPWFTTLFVWHLVQQKAAGQPMSPLDAANLARHQFANAAFPSEFRRWLVAALPQALRALQPGGDEWPAIVTAAAAASASGIIPADSSVARANWLAEQFSCWPWRGGIPVSQLFSANAIERARAAQNVADQLLKSDDNTGDWVAACMRELAASITIYGCG